MIRHRSTWLLSMLAVAIAASAAQAQPKAAPTAAPAAHAPPKGTPTAAATAQAPAKGAPTAAPVAEAPHDPTLKLFEEGTADLNAGKFAEAAEKLRAAWARRNAYDIAGNLGAALLKLGKHAEAARFLSYAADNFPVGGKPGVRKMIEDMLAEATREVVTLRVKVSEDGAAVKVNGADAGTSPMTARTFVEAGAIVIEVQKAGFEDTRLQLQGEKGGTLEAPIVMRKKTSGGTEEPNRLPAYIALGAGGVGLVLGVATGVAAVAKKNDVAGACSPTNVCPIAARGDYDTALTLARVSTVGLVVAGVGAAVGVTLLVVSSRKAPPAASLVVGPAFLGVKGAF